MDISTVTSVNEKKVLSESKNLQIVDKKINLSVKGQYFSNYVQYEELHVDPPYWEQTRIVMNKGKTKPKLQISNRKTVRECTIIDNNKSIPRHPSYFNFDSHTTSILETLPLEMGPLMNIVGKGNHSVVIYADCLPSSNIYYPNGYAVKVYRLTTDVKKNIAILKRVQNEADHLLRVKQSQFITIPQLVYHSRNVLVTSFIGTNQETGPRIDSLPEEDLSLGMYNSVVHKIEDWYSKGIVHGNLCDKNMVNYNCYIGWSHSVLRKHPQALIKLMKDCLFVTNFFGRCGVPVKTPEELFKDITGLNKISSKVLEVIHKSDLWNKQANPNKSRGYNTMSCRNNRFKTLHENYYYT